MSSDNDKYVEYLKRTTKELRQVRERIRELEYAAGEPLAVVGVGCRFPGGVGSVDGLWGVVSGGCDVVGRWPGDRGWDEGLFDPRVGVVGRSYSRWGGFLEGAGLFDAGFFGVSPREALEIDPQQRLVLEVGWEALENAGLDPRGLGGAEVGVFMGVMYHDYGLIGQAGSLVSGRLAYVLGLGGPAVSVDTACSSSLVALHQAGLSLRAGECELALVGGVTVMATPEIFVEFSRQRGLAPDGRCKSFAAAADGVGWAEGVGVLVVERLCDAQRHGHEILAVVRGSAVNQDGASNGLTAPNGPAQQRVIQAALANANLSAGQVDVVEAHGTGTRLGDPIEAQAILATYGQRDHSRPPLWLGSIKSNIGHTQAAAGVAGIIKMIEAMRHGVLPKTLHVDEPTPHVDWTTGHVQILTEHQPWPDTSHPRRAAVSSFGISGTNAHIILEQPPQLEPPTVAERPPILAWTLSARTREALRDCASRLHTHLLNDPDIDPGAVAAALARRSVFEHRAVVTGSTREQLLTELTHLPDPEIPAGAGKTAFVFTGQGSQRLGMGRQLYHTYPVFAQAWDNVEQHLRLPVRDIAWGHNTTELTQTLHAQTALFTLHIALFRLLESWKILPDYMIGHSIGEISAAHLAGVLTLTDAATLVTERANLMQSLPDDGAMLAVRAPADELIPLLSQDMDIAAINSPTATLIAGTVAAVDELESDLCTAGFRVKRLNVSHAFHSAAIQPVLDRLGTALGTITPAPARIPVIADPTGELADEGYATAEYWTQHARSTVHFAKGIVTLERQQVHRFLEIGPHSGLLTHIAETAPGAATIALLHPKRPEPQSLFDGLAALHAAGHTVDWSAHYPRPRPGTRLPTYAFQHQSYWLSRAAIGDATGHGLRAIEHPILSAAIDDPDTGDVHLSGRLTVATHPWLADHAILGQALLPGTAFVELALRAADETGCSMIRELMLRTPLAIPEKGAVQVHVVVRGASGADRSVSISSRLEGAEQWTTHAEGTLAVADAPEPAIEAASWPPLGTTPIAIDGAYDALARLGYDYGPTFRGVRAAWRRGDEIAVEVELPDTADAAGFAIHPALLDAATHTFLLDGGELVLPFVWNDVRLHAAHASTVRALGLPLGPGRMSLRAMDVQGDPVLTVGSIVGRPFSPDQLNGPGRLAGALFEIDWQRVELADSAATAVREWDDVPDPSSVDAVVVFRVQSRAKVSADQVLPRVRHTLAAVLDMLRRWTADPATGRERLLIVTRGAVALPGEDIGDLPSAAVWGLVRAAQAEHPGRILLADIDDDTDPARLAATAEPELMVRDGQAWVPRLTQLPATEPPAVESPGALSLRTGTVLITGGTGVLGALVARHLVDTHGARNLLLVSRSGEKASGAAALRAELAELGTEVDVVACDVADRDALRAVLAAIPADKPLVGVVHTAGVLDTGVLDGLDTDRLDATVRPKVDGAWHLHVLTRDLDLSFFVLFSSIGGLILAGGQGWYAAANVFLDALAAHRRARGLPATSLAWGPWEGARMGTEVSAPQADRIRRQGISTLTDSEGLRLLDAALGTGHPVVAPMHLNRAALRARTDELPALLRGLAPRSVRNDAAGVDKEAALRARLAPLTEARRRQQVLAVIRAAAADVLSHRSSADVAPDATFQELGFDSLAAMEFRARMRAETGMTMPVTVVFDHPTPDQLARHLVTELGFAEPVPLDRETENTLRRRLATISAEELRAAGVLDVLLDLTQARNGAAPPGADVLEFDTMDAGALVNHVLAGPRRAPGGERP
ncbi:type I polyketide synthase [Nocardia sp. CA-135953]|uniref:type I polyketide synthase n=1 Tax=Nocardia sp. CA-135953 TaxID=3239978 RepID=UPI003D95724E